MVDGNFAPRSESGEYEFYAFVSYELGNADEKWAIRLQRELKRYRVPVTDLQGSRSVLPKRLRVFRDEPGLNSCPAVEQGLSENPDSSRWLIVICSPRSANSLRVDAEVRCFVEMGKGENIIPFYIGAENASPKTTPVELARDARKFRPASIPAEAEPVIASDGETWEKTFIGLLARMLRVDFDNLLRAHLKASRRRTFLGLCGAAALLILTAALGMWALSAEARATALRAETEALVDFLTFDLIREASPWLPSDKLVLVYGRVGEYYGRWDANGSRALFAQAVNLDQRAGAAALDFPEKENGGGENADALYTRALEILESLRRENPGDESYFAKYSQTLLSAGLLREQEGNPDDAEACYLRSLSTAEKFSEEFPGSLKGRAQTADSLTSLSRLAASESRHDEAETFARKASEIWGGLMAGWPEETRTWLWRMRFADFLSARCYVTLIRGDYAAAIDYVGGALSILSEFYDEDPENLVIRLLFADGLGDAAFIAAKCNVFEPAELYFSLGEEIWRSLAEEDPRPGYQFGLSGVLVAGGLLRIEQGRPGEAVALLDEADGITGGLLERDPRNAAYLARKELIAEYRERANRVLRKH
jgi:tetratricopeptide (TPR) repeat protein